jgi:hypothetical protein
LGPKEELSPNNRTEANNNEIKNSMGMSASRPEGALGLFKSDICVLPYLIGSKIYYFSFDYIIIMFCFN